MPDIRMSNYGRDSLRCRRRHPHRRPFLRSPRAVMLKPSSLWLVRRLRQRRPPRWQRLPHRPLSPLPAKHQLSRGKGCANKESRPSPGRWSRSSRCQRRARRQRPSRFNPPRRHRSCLRPRELRALLARRQPRRSRARLSPEPHCRMRPALPLSNHRRHRLSCRRCRPAVPRQLVLGKAVRPPRRPLHRSPR